MTPRRNTPRDQKPKPIDPAIVAAIAAAVATQFPGARVTRIEAAR